MQETKENSPNDFDAYFRSFLPEPFLEPFVSEAKREYETGSSFDEAVLRAVATAPIELPPIEPGWDLLMEAGIAPLVQREIDGIRKQLKANTEGNDLLALTIDAADARTQSRIALHAAYHHAMSRVIEKNAASINPAFLGKLIANLELGSPPILLSPRPDIPLETRGGERGEAGSGSGSDGDGNAALERLVQAIDIPLTVGKKVKALLAVILSAFGVEFLLEVVLGELTLFRLFYDLYLALRAKDSALIKKLLEKIIKHFTSVPFRKAVIKKLGKKAAESMLGRILAALIPFIGYALIIGTMLYSLYQHWDEIIDDP